MDIVGTLTAKFDKRTAGGVAMAIGVAFSVSPWASSATALLLGIFIAVTPGNPFAAYTRIYAQKLLAWSVIGLGAGMNLITVGQAGVAGLGYTIVTISLTLALGLLLGRVVGSERQTSVLIAAGTAICGGSAIAAIAPVIRARPQAIIISMGAVFLLNALALIIMPGIGHYFGLTQNQFGIWSALAIHDTSSVVGATLQYGPEALRVGTTVKLARALWIVPLAFGFGFYYRDKTGETQARAKKPWFIAGFVGMAALVTYVPALQPVGYIVELTARKALVLTLFLIGSNLLLGALREVGPRPLIQAVVLWVAVSVSTLMFVSCAVP